MAKAARMSMSLRQQLARKEREILLGSLRAHRGRVADVAEALGLSRRAVEKKLHEHELWAEAQQLRTA